MNPTLCSRCKKNVAVVYITRLDAPGQPGTNEGLCLKCARELKIRPVTDMLDKMGLSDDDLEALTNDMASLMSGDGLAALQEAAALGNATSKGGRQTAFEKACDNALNNYLRQTQMTPFGDSVVVSYAAARENEITAARIILSGRLAGVSADTIRERLRDAYV